MQLKAHSYCLVSLTWWFECPAHPLYLAAAARLPWRNCFAGNWFGIAAYSYSVFVVWGSLFNFVLALSWVWMISFAEPLHCRAPLKKSPLICRCLPSAQISGRPWVSSLYLLGLVCLCEVSRLIHIKKSLISMKVLDAVGVCSSSQTFALAQSRQSTTAGLSFDQFGVDFVCGLHCQPR